MSNGANEPKKNEKAVPTVLVLVLSSVMLSVGAAAFLLVEREPSYDAPPVPHVQPVHVTVDTRTPEHTAESFLDAWRKRAHDDAMRISVDEAYERVRVRRDAERRLSPEDRAFADTVWRRLADMRLHLEISESARDSDQRLSLRGLAKGMWLGKAYERPVDFVLVEKPEGWRVMRFSFGAAPEQDMPRIEE